MTAVYRPLPCDDFRRDSEALIARVDGRLAMLAAGREPVNLRLAGRLAETLRELIIATTRASAADRARVRAAVHYFVLGRSARRARPPGRGLADDVRVVNGVAADLGRTDLLVDPAAQPV
ncbi:hypothetical protein [Rhizomonospora bruguierae]|uniref:hypothetical protein n=1 Tax=Rhizomonospora bruguierae TaxID=1581705 RepID=UPI001BCD3F55|nr:hypothetical protein [Micromonospora sp. NBRC 107566]